MAGRSELSMFEYLPKNVQSLPDLHQIALTGNTAKLSELLSQDSTIASSVDIYGRTALHLVSSHGVYYSLKLLCKYCSKEMLDRPDCYRYTALHYAAQGAHTHCAKLLLESGSDVNLTQHTQNTPLHLAALYAYPEMVALLCRHGADVHARNASQETPFQAATRSAYRNRGRVEFHCTILALILNSGSSVTVQDNEGITPLHHVAMYCEREQCTALLCAAGANVRRQNHGNITAAQLARIAATKRMLRKLRKTPPKLEHFCMLVIRQRLGTCLRTKAEQLPLPKALKDKLLHKTLSKVI